MYNRITLVGRLTKDPDLRYTQAGKAVASFRLAVGRGRKDGSGKEETDFIDHVVWDKQAELVSQYCTKGKLVLTEGRLQQRTYDAQDGSKRTVYEVVASTVRFMPDGNRGNGGQAPAAGGGDWVPDDDSEDSIPF